MGPLIALFMGKIRATDGEAVDGKWLNSPDFSGAQSMANTSRAMSEIPYNSEYQIAIFGALADVGPMYPGVRMEKQPLVYRGKLVKTAKNSWWIFRLVLFFLSRCA